MAWTCDLGGDIRPTTSREDISNAIDTRVAAEVDRHRRYAKILGLNETETDARLDGIAVTMRERCQAWASSKSVSFARTMVLSETPLPFDPDEVEKIMRATSREVDDRYLSLQIAHARVRGFPMWLTGAGRCEGPATREVHERETMVMRSGLTPRSFESIRYGGSPSGLTNHHG